MKLDKGDSDPQSIANAVMAFSKSQNGSSEFFRALEAHILRSRDLFSCQELANLIYSYHKSEHASTELLNDLVPSVISRLDNMNPRELTTILLSYTE